MNFNYRYDPKQKKIIKESLIKEEVATLAIGALIALAGAILGMLGAKYLGGFTESGARAISENHKSLKKEVLDLIEGSQLSEQEKAAAKQEVEKAFSDTASKVAEISKKEEGTKEERQAKFKQIFSELYNKLTGILNKNKIPADSIQSKLDEALKKDTRTIETQTAEPAEYEKIIDDLLKNQNKEEKKAAVSKLLEVYYKNGNDKVFGYLSQIYNNELPNVPYGTLKTAFSETSNKDENKQYQENINKLKQKFDEIDRSRSPEQAAQSDAGISTPAPAATDTVSTDNAQPAADAAASPAAGGDAQAAPSGEAPPASDSTQPPEVPAPPSGDGVEAGIARALDQQVFLDEDFRNYLESKSADIKNAESVNDIRKIINSASKKFSYKITNYNKYLDDVESDPQSFVDDSYNFTKYFSSSGGLRNKIFAIAKELVSQKSGQQPAEQQPNAPQSQDSQSNNIAPPVAEPAPAATETKPPSIKDIINSTRELNIDITLDKISNNVDTYITNVSTLISQLERIKNQDGDRVNNFVNLITSVIAPIFRILNQEQILKEAASRRLLQTLNQAKFVLSALNKIKEMNPASQQQTQQQSDANSATSNAMTEDNVPVCEACLYQYMLDHKNILTEAKYHGKSVQLGKPSRGDVKKYKVFVKDPQTGNIKKVNFGDPNMEIKRDNPARRKNFRARHNCDNPGPRTKARYWSCRFWSRKPVSKMVEESEEVKESIQRMKEMAGLVED